MYSNELLSKQRTKFWTSFGQYMKPIPGAAGEKVNWLNYKTGIRQIFFKMDVTYCTASVGIKIRHTDEVERLLYFTQFLSMKSLMENNTGFQWTWEANVLDEHAQTVSSISLSLPGISIANESDWPVIISFLKPRMLALERFWEMVKDGFE